MCRYPLEHIDKDESRFQQDVYNSLYWYSVGRGAGHAARWGGTQPRRDAHLEVNENDELIVLSTDE